MRYVSETGRVDVRLQTNQEPTYYTLREQLLSGSVDLVFATEVDDPKVGLTPIGEHRLVLLVPKGHRLDGAGSVSLRELDREDFIAYSRDCQLRHQMDSQFRNVGVRPNITVETAQDIIIFGLVAAGRGIAITPYPLGATPYNVSVVPVEDLPMRKLYLMWNKEAYLPPAAAGFRDFIVRRGRVFDDYWVRNGVG